MFSVLYKGITIIVEIIWSLSKAHIYSDFLILSNSFANIKVLIVNHEFFEQRNKDKYKSIRREYDKLRISEIRRGYIISEPFDSNLVITGMMDDIKHFLDYSITLLSADNRLHEKHLTVLKDHIVKPLISFLNTNGALEGILKILNESLFNDYLKHFNLESQWKAITRNKEERLRLIDLIRSEFRDFCGQNDIPVVEETENTDAINNIPINDFVERLLVLSKNPSFESILPKRLTIHKYSSESIIYFRMHEKDPGNISIVYQGGNETERIYNALSQYLVNSVTSRNISTLKELEKTLETDFIKLKEAVEYTLYSHILPTNTKCPFLTV